MLAVLKTLGAALPIRHSMARYQILGAVLASRCEEGIGFKQMLLDSNFSKTAVRYQLDQLTKDGWLDSVPDPIDRRRKKIIATKKLRVAAKKLLEVKATQGPWR